MKKFIVSLFLLVPSISFAQIVSNEWSEVDTVILVANIIKLVVLGVLLYSILRLGNNIVNYFKLKKDVLRRLDKVDSSINYIIIIILMVPIFWVANLFTETSCCVLPESSTAPMQSL